MHSPQDVSRAIELSKKGFGASTISEIIGIPRSTVSDWINGRAPTRDRGPYSCSRCDPSKEINQFDYLYLLGLYLGDGCISTSRKKVHRLRIICCNDYPGLMNRCAETMHSLIPRKVGRVVKPGCTEVYSDSTHWTCMFPQHGPGRKHERAIRLADWQQELVDTDPRPLVEGLLHSDGCRVLNWVNGTPYSRYHFTNASRDIRQIFTDACGALGIDWTMNSPRDVSVARRSSVAILDSFVSAKR